MRCALVVLAACATARAPAPQAPKLAPGANVEREISEGQTHQYAIALDADSVLLVEVDQRGADVSLSTYGPDGSQLATLDSSTGGKGTETVRVEAKQAGTYRLDVIGLAGGSGKYRARVVEIISAKELAARDAKQRA